jgi:hypothetical protein
VGLASFTLNFLLMKLALRFALLPAWLLLLTVLSGCNSAARRQQEFLARYAHEDFTQFRGLSVFIRGADQAGNTLLVLADTRLTADCRGETPLTFVTVSTQTRQVQAVRHDFPTTCSPRLSRPQLLQLTAAFLRYRVQNLRVDASGNVFAGFQTRRISSTDLILAHAPAQLDSDFYTHYAPVSAGWYARKAAN